MEDDNHRAIGQPGKSVPEVADVFRPPPWPLSPESTSSS